MKQTQAAVNSHAPVSRSSLLLRWFLVLIPGTALYFFPLGLSLEQRHLLAVFAATIIALVARPVPMGVSVLVAMTVLVLTRTVPPNRALAGFANPTVWLIFSAFLFARAVTMTGFGLRIAYLFIRRFGRSTLALGYSVAASDLVLAPFIPSDTARGGGIIYPITRSVAQALGSEPGPTADRVGAFLILAAFHATYTASGMFLTGMASNPIIVDFARSIAHIEITWLQWAAAASVPGLLTMLGGVYLIYRICAPGLSDTTAARRMAADELKRMGSLSSAERRLVVILLAVMAGWVSSPWHGIHNAFVALAGVSAILLLGVLSWDDLLADAKAWDALIWFAPLLMMADELTRSGTIQVLSHSVFGKTRGWPWPVVLVVLGLLYLYIHYCFASMTAHVTALYPGFLAAGLAAGCPPLMLALLLAFFSNLDAGLTHYGTGSAPVYFNAGYVPLGRWWRVGLLISFMNVVLWLGLGPLWWKLIRLW